METTSVAAAALNLISGAEGRGTARGNCTEMMRHELAYVTCFSGLWSMFEMQLKHISAFCSNEMYKDTTIFSNYTFWVYSPVTCFVPSCFVQRNGLYKVHSWSWNESLFELPHNSWQKVLCAKGPPFQVKREQTFHLEWLHTCNQLY